MKILDTSFLVSFYLPSDQNNQKAIEMMVGLEDEELILTDVILFETLTVLNYKSGNNFCGVVYEELTSNKNIRYICLNELERSEVLDLFLKGGKKLSVADVSVIYIAKKTHSSLLSFDLALTKDIN